YTAWHLLLASVYSEEGCSALADDDSLDGQDTGEDVDIASIGESPQWVLGLHDLSSVCQKINPHTPPAAAQARLPRYLLFCCWKNDLA
ncbi:MAG TPA: hypothetical protein PKD78_09185, partial [Saprospiraceae bacterium]|nr:hypothetical protein [Saprospiraceae bacterium]